MFFATAFDFGDVGKDVLPARGCGHFEGVHVVFFGEEKLGASQADGFEDFENVLEVHCVEDGACELDVPEVSWAVDVSFAISGANESGVKNPHARVKQTSDTWATIGCISISGHDFNNGISPDLFGREHSELNADDS